MSKGIQFLAVAFWSYISVSYGQLEKQYWHFNTTSRGLFFDPANSYAPVLTTNSSTPYSGEGCSVVTHPITGELQFYSDGLRVIDKSHAQMLNGGGLNGSLSCLSNGKVCLVPGSCTQYYVFSNSYATEAGSGGSLYYSIVDMSLVGNGTVGNEYGAVVAGQKNVFVATGISEAVEIIPKHNSHDYWMIVGENATSQMLIYEITSGGISFISTYNLPYVMQDMRSISYCAVNNKIALMSCIEVNPGLILDFDPATGTITSTLQIPGTPFGPSPLYWMGTAYSEWSPDGTKLYMSKYRTSTPASGGKLYQYDLNLPANPPTLIFNLGANTNHVARGLRLAPDGKIYFLYTNTSGGVRYFCTVGSPNNPAATCNFQQNSFDMGVDLGNSTALPFFLTWHNTIPSIPDSTIVFPCQLPGSVSFDPIAGYLDNESDNLSFTVNAVTGGSYNVTGSTVNFTPDPGFIGNPEIEIIYQDDFCFPLSDTFVVALNISVGTGTLNLSDSLAACTGSTVQLDAGVGFSTCVWSTGATTQFIDVVVSGMYSVEATDGTCTYLDSTFVVFGGPTSVFLGPDQMVCADSLLLAVGAFGGTINWSDGSIGVSNWVSTTGQYSVIAENSSGCLSYDTIDVILNPLPAIDLGADQHHCQGDIVTLFAIGYVDVLWSTGSTSDELVVSSSGTFSVEVLNEFGCQKVDTVQVLFHTPVQVSLGPDLTVCDTEVLLATSGFTGIVNWSDGSVGNVNLVTHSGQFSVVAEDMNGCLSYDTIDVILAPIPSLNFGADTLICPDEFYLVAAGFESVLWSNGLDSDSISITESGTYSAEVVNSFGCLGYDQILIEILDPSVIELGADIETCSQQEITLSTGLNHGTFQWSSGEQTSTISVTESGTYYVTQHVCGEEITDSVKIEITTLNQTVYIPNAFTPDGNSLNSTFEIVFGDYTHITSYQLSIYNRWGAVIFQTNDPNEAWTGTGKNGLVQDGIYTYVVKIETDCDENPVWIKTGHITLLK